MLRKEAAEAREFGDDIVRIAPGEAATGMDIDLLRREPFDSAGVTKSAAVAGERAKLISQERPGAALCRETLVVVCFAVMNQCSNGAAFDDAVIEIAADLDV